MSEKCTYTVDDKGIAILKFNNPPLNTLDEDTMYGLEVSMKRLASDDAVKVVIVTGEGDTFVVGADVNKVRNVKTFDEGVRLTTQAQGIVNLIENCRKPVIAAINGLALGGGTEIAMACHMRLMSDQAQMGLPEIMLGIMPAFGGTQRAVRLLGTSRALEIMLTGKFISSAEAEMIGLVNAVITHEKLMDEAMKLAKQIANKGQCAVRAILEAVMVGGALSLEEGLKLESRLFGKLAETEDKEEGIAAFLDKRKPQFKDR